MKKLLLLVLLASTAFAETPVLPPVFAWKYAFINRVQVVDPVYVFDNTNPTLTAYPVTFLWSDWYVNQNPPNQAGPVGQSGPGQTVDLVANGAKTVTDPVSKTTVSYAVLMALLQQVGVDNYVVPVTATAK